MFAPTGALFTLTIAAGQVLPGRYIVELAGDPAVAGTIKSGRRDAAIQRRAAILTQQARLRASIERSDTTVVDSVDTVANALFVRMSAKRGSELAGYPGVFRVYPETMCKMTLDHALTSDKRLPELGGEKIVI